MKRWGLALFDLRSFSFAPRQHSRKLGIALGLASGEYVILLPSTYSRSAWEFSEHTATQCRMPYEILYSETSSSSGRMVPTFHL